MVESYERGTTWKTTIQFISGSTYIDPSGNLAYLNAYYPDGTLVWPSGSVSGSRQSQGYYYAYVTTESTDPLGLYVLDWYGSFNYGTTWGYRNKHQREDYQEKLLSFLNKLTVLEVDRIEKPGHAGAYLDRLLGLNPAGGANEHGNIPTFRLGHSDLRRGRLYEFVLRTAPKKGETAQDDHKTFSGGSVHDGFFHSREQ